jgi:hypothetical protein
VDSLDSVLLTPDGKWYACSYLRTVSHLYFVEGLKLRVGFGVWAVALFQPLLAMIQALDSASRPAEPAIRDSLLKLVVVPSQALFRVALRVPLGRGATEVVSGAACEWRSSSLTNFPAPELPKIMCFWAGPRPQTWSSKIRDLCRGRKLGFWARARVPTTLDAC